MEKIRFVKLKRGNDFESQKYKLFIDDKEIRFVSDFDVHIDAKSIVFTEVTVKLITNDFKFIYEEDELSGNSSSD